MKLTDRSVVNLSHLKAYAILTHIGGEAKIFDYGHNSLRLQQPYKW